MSDHLLVRELITLGGLNDTVEHENITVGLGLEDKNILEEGLLLVQDLLDPVRRISTPAIPSMAFKLT